LLRCCRDCANFEDRRDIDGVAICSMHHGPSVCCAEFEPKNQNRLYNRFCVECVNFAEISEIPFCARHHAPGVACDGFRSKLEKSRSTQRENIAKTAVLEYALAHSDSESISPFVMEIARKIKW
jgi:hypothetical protein